MHLGDLIRTFRSDMDDTVIPYRWSRDDVIDYANDAVNEACRRARLLIDSTTPAVTSIAVSPGAALYPLDARIIFVRRVKLVGRKPLTRLSTRDLDAAMTDWETVEGTPLGFITDYQSGAIRLYPVPSEAGILNLTAVRLPLTVMDDDEDQPEIAPRFHASLVNWMKYRAFLRNDGDTLNEQAALKYLALFEQEFGPRSSALDELWIEREQAFDLFDGTQ